MKLEQIKETTDKWFEAYDNNYNMNGREIVHWSNCSYYVTKQKNGYLIVYEPNSSAIGLTHKDGKTLNGKKSEFYTCAGLRCTHELLGML